MNQLGAVTGRHAFDVGRLAAHLEQHLPDFRGPVEVQQFQGGQSNPTYLIATPTAKYVMRSKPGPSAKLLPSAHAVEREFHVMRALAAQGIPVPWTLLLVEDESVIGRAFYLMQHVEGRIFWDQSLPDLDRVERASIYDEMNRVIARLHSVDIERAGLDRPLEQAVPGFGDRSHRGDGPPDRVAAEAHPRRGRNYRRARRLPHGQPDLPPYRAAHHRHPRLGAFDPRPSAGGLFLPLHELAHPAWRIPRHRRPRSTTR